ncbi:MAG TPA: hypothetical protein VLT59_11175, partial [Steroidobacteraceae bacterium]|nr:hypothetical protein [Steroidobacteraceae bacterium]
PFRSLSEVASAAAVLRAEGFEPTQRVEAGDVWVGYWVSWRGAAGREQAEATRLLLAERGLTDTYVLPAGEQSNVLSLGVFTDRRRAERRREEVRLLGLEAEISDRRQAGSVYWIDVEPGESDPAIDPGMLVTDPGRIVRLEVRPCRAPGNPAGEPSQRPAESVAPPPSSEADAAVSSDSVPRDPA